MNLVTFTDCESSLVDRITGCSRFVITILKVTRVTIIL